MATLSVKFIKVMKRYGASYYDREIVKSVSFVGRRMVSEEKKNKYDLAYYCRKTKSQCECWLVKYDGVWHIYCNNNNLIPSVRSYNCISVNVN